MAETTWTNAAADQPVAPYHAIALEAVLSAVCAGLSFLAIFGWLFALIPVAGILLGWRALVRIAAHSDLLTGRGVAWAGIVGSALLGPLGLAGLLATELREVPTGYKLVEFADLEPDLSAASNDDIVPAKLKEYAENGDPIYVRGYMYPGSRTVGLKDFVIVPSENHCSICQPQLKPWETIRIKLSGDLRTDYTSRRKGIGGRLKIHPEVANNPYGGCLYEIEGDYVY